MQLIMDGRRCIIHVNRQFIAMNAKDGKDRPVYTIKWGSKTIYATEVQIDGTSKCVYNGTQLTCGARAWIEVTSGSITLVEPRSFAEAKAA